MDDWYFATRAARAACVRARLIEDVGPTARAVEPVTRSNVVPHAPLRATDPEPRWDGQVTRAA